MLSLLMRDVFFLANLALALTLSESSSFPEGLRLPRAKLVKPYSVLAPGFFPKSFPIYGIFDNSLVC